MTTWAVDEAIVHLSYLRKCANEAQQIEYLAAALSVTEAKGALRGTTEACSALTPKAEAS